MMVVLRRICRLRISIPCSYGLGFRVCLPSIGCNEVISPACLSINAKSLLQGIQKDLVVVGLLEFRGYQRETRVAHIL